MQALCERGRERDKRSESVHSKSERVRELDWVLVYTISGVVSASDWWSDKT